MAVPYRAALLATAVFAALNAHGQDNRGLEEVVVTAQRREQLQQETPVAITAISESMVRDMQITTVQDVGKAVPNLQLFPVTANPSTFQVGLRGGAEQTGGLIVSEPVVGIYVDDVYRARLQGANAQLLDIERIEVLRGPQGTLYGRNTFSGAIKLVTRTPSMDNSWLDAGIGVGNFDETVVRASVGGGLSENVGASFAVMYRDQADGWIYNRVTDREIGAEENLALRGKLVWKAGDWDLTAIADYGDDENDGYIPVSVQYVNGPPGAGFADRVSTADTRPVPGFDEYMYQSPTPTRGETTQWGLSLAAERDFGKFTFRSITAYRDLEDFFQWDLAGGLEVAPNTFLPGFDRQADATADQFTQEFQLLGEAFDSRLKWIAGVYYFTESGEQSFIDGGAFFAPITGSPFTPLPLFVQNIDTESYAVFGQATWAFNDRLSVTAGLRYTRDDKTFDATIAPPTALAVNLDESYDAWTPKLGIEYIFSDNLFGFASVSRGFKAGGFNGLDRRPEVLTTDYDPQFVWTWEAGLKGDWYDNRLRTNLTVFFNQLEDLQQTSIGPAGSFPVQNVGDADLFGIELEISAQPVEGLNLFANLGYMDDDYGSLVPGAAAATAGAVGLPLVAEYTAQIGGVYETAVLGGWLFRVGGDYRYTDEYFNNVQNNLVIEGYGRLDAFVALRTPNEAWELAFEGRNLTDEANYVTSAIPSLALTILKPRTYMLSLRYRRP